MNAHQNQHNGLNKDKGHYRVSKNVPIPKVNSHRSKYRRLYEAIERMELGDMITLKTEPEVSFARKTLSEAGFRATVRKYGSGHRVWKVEAKNNGE